MILKLVIECKLVIKVMNISDILNLFWFLNFGRLSDSTLLVLLRTHLLSSWNMLLLWLHCVWMCGLVRVWVLAIHKRICLLRRPLSRHEIILLGILLSRYWIWSTYFRLKTWISSWLSLVSSSSDSTSNSTSTSYTSFTIWRFHISRNLISRFCFSFFRLRRFLFKFRFPISSQILTFI